MSGNVAISIFDHLAQFLIMPSVKKKNKLANSRPKLHMDMKSIELNKDYIFTSLKNENWESKLAVNLNNANISTELLLDSVNGVLNYHCPLKKISNSQKKNQNKPRITQGILKSIAVNNKRHRKMCRTKDLMRKTELEKKLSITNTTL